MKISMILEKRRAPNKNVFCKGLEYELFSSESLRPPRRRAPASTEQNPGAEYETEVVPAAVVVNLVEAHVVREERDDEGDRCDHPVPQTEPEASDASIRGGDVHCGVGTSGTARQEQSAQEYQAQQVRFLHCLFSFKVQFSTALLPQRLSVSCDSDNTANIAYMGLKVKPNRKSPYFRAFSGVLYLIKRIKKFSSPKIKIWFEPMFFSGFFCGFERCGSAAFPNFRGGNCSPPQAAKCVRTNSRILHHVGKVKEFWFASLRSATNLYSILGVKTNSRFRILGEENFLILNF